MAITRVDPATPGGGTSNGSDFTISLGTLAAGDVVYVAAGCNGTRSITSGGRANGPYIDTEGYTQIAEAINPATSPGYYLRVFRKVMGSTPDTSVIVDIGGNASVAGVAMIYCLRGVDNTTPEDTTPTTNYGTSTNPDGPAITTVSPGAWVLSFVSSQVHDTASTYPVGWSDGYWTSFNDTFPARTGRVRVEQATPGSVDPGPWGDWASGNWAGVTVAVRPGGLAPAARPVVFVCT
jgi:hypothetical protein